MKAPKFAERWWRAKEWDAHGSVFAVARDMERDQASRRADNAIYRRLFGAKGHRVSIYGDQAPVVGTSAEGVLTTNIIRTAVEVLCSKVARAKPKATFVTSGGSWSEQRRARRLDDYVYGVMHSADFYRKARKAFTDASVTDLGVIKGSLQNGRICLERVDPDSIRVDTADGYEGTPRTLIQVSVRSRDQVKAWVEQWHADKTDSERAAMFAAVDRASAALDSARNIERSTTFGDVIDVVEAWHLPSIDVDDDTKKHDGRHVVSISTLTLVDEPATFFPFAFCRVYEPFQGFYGQGVAEVLIQNQRTLNGVLRRISETIRLMSKPRLFFDSASTISMTQIAGGEEAMIIRGGQPPTILAGNNVPPELWTLMEQTIRHGLAQAGISEGAATAQKPAGLNSGQALRDFTDIQSERHALVHQSYEEFVIDVARLVLRLSKEAADKGETLSAFVPRGRGSDEVSWADVESDEKSLVLRVFSSSSLPVTPAARKQYVEELWSSGQIDSAEYRRLLDIPDTAASTDLALAARDVVDMVLEKMLDGDDDDGAEEDYTPPEPFDDLAYAVKRGMAVYAFARTRGAPEQRLSYVRRYIIQAEEMKRQAEMAMGDMRAPDAAQPTMSNALGAMAAP